MWHFRFGRRLAYLALIAVMGLLAGCNGDAEEEATAQAAIEQLVSTNTPSPEPTETPPPTDTPLPPTDTPPPPPTDTPVPPTETNTPVPSPSPPPGIGFDDPVGDVVNCDTQEAVDDLEVDIAAITAVEQERNLILQVMLNNPLVNDYSFAVLLTLVSGEALNYYLWETHDSVQQIGEIDSQTGELSPQSAEGGLAIDHDQTAGEVTFTIPISRTAVFTDTTSISNTITISGTNSPLEQVYVSSFHTPQEGEEKNCDTAGPFLVGDW